MNDWSNCDRERLAAVEPVVKALSTIVPAEQIMLVGAQCRDLLHWRFGCSGAPPRSTNDTDIAVALRDWDQFVRLRERFPTIGDSGHRLLIEGIPTDVIPFGDVEAPPGMTSHPLGKEVLNVHGFRDAYERAHELPISEGFCIRIPRPEGYAILKTHAWLDRSASYEYKDGPDLALAVYWYAQDAERLYEDQNQWALDLHDFDLHRAAAALLGKDMRNGLSLDEFAVLANRIAGADQDLLAQHFGAGRASWPTTGPRRRPLVDAMFDQLVPDHVQ
jgi:predicted nucleotidyltransferase